MLKLDRRSFLATTAGLSFLSVLPRIALADGHADTLRVAIAGETGDLDLLQNVHPVVLLSGVRCVDPLWAPAARWSLV